MPSKIETAYAVSQRNVYEGMLRDLARHLGVRPDSLARLDLGWAPVVQFTNGPNYDGWWCIPERDDTGNVVGLGLRNQEDKKLMMPGSAHGLMYEVNPLHERGRKAYKPGPSNWVRTSEALPCAVCDKPDGCLLSRENPEDPQAVICRVEKKGAEKQMGLGWLHIRKSEGLLQSGTSPILSSDYPVLVVEGMTDVAAAMDMGLVAVGRPSNSAGLETLKSLLRGRKALIVGENDAKPNGSKPGEEGAVSAFLVLRSVCKDLRRVMPPAVVKDLRQWKNRFDLNAEQLFAYAEAHGVDVVQESILPDDRASTSAHAYLQDNHRLSGRWSLRNYAGVWYEYSGGRYKEVPDKAVGLPLYEWAETKFLPGKDGQMAPVKATRNWVKDVLEAAAAETIVKTEEIPCWINDATGPGPGDLIPFQNGSLHVPTYLKGTEFSGYMRALTPDYFSLVCLPFSFDPDAKCPSFRKWVESSLGDDPAKILLLQEWTGYLMTQDTSHQKFMWLQGKTAAGKSLYLNTISNLLGPDQCAPLRLHHLSGRFGLSALMGKLVAVLPDLRTHFNQKLTPALETILNISGGDRVVIERKFKDAEGSLRITARLMASSNEPPQFEDSTGAFLRRMLLINFDRSFAGREDMTLEERIRGELPGVAVWALEGLRRLRENGGFTMPKSSYRSLNEWDSVNQPVKEFIEECVEVADGFRTPRVDMLTAYRRWAAEQGGVPQGSFTMSNFDRMFMGHVPKGVGKSRELVASRHKYVYTGVQLNRGAQRDYLGRPLNS